ncbi:MAG: histidine triad nucleotide-binding protein [Nitrospinae bacterium]|nr:histidine triad nucleotide-binding protein [Nitrospinota bacterium]
MDGCIFCKIIKGEIPNDKIHETDNILIIEDKHPQAPKHYLAITKKHIQDVMNLTEEDKGLMAEMLNAVQEVARKKKLAENGFRMVMNHGLNGGQTIFHLHMHILGGRPMNWPPG